MRAICVPERGLLHSHTTWCGVLRLGGDASARQPAGDTLGSHPQQEPKHTKGQLPRIVDDMHRRGQSQSNRSDPQNHSIRNS